MTVAGSQHDKTYENRIGSRPDFPVQIGDADIHRGLSETLVHDSSTRTGYRNDHPHAPGDSPSAPVPAIVPSSTALLVMHYQTDILGLFPSVAPELLANTRRLCDAARAGGIGVWFANLRFSPGYPEVSPRNKNGQASSSSASSSTTARARNSAGRTTSR